MHRWLMVVRLLLVAVVTLWLGSTLLSRSSHGAARAQVGGATPCGCPAGTKCCVDCNGNRICIRTPGQCPECPAP